VTEKEAGATGVEEVGVAAADEEAGVGEDKVEARA